LLRPKHEELTTQQLVDGAVSVVERAPAAVFSVAELLISHVKQKGGQEERVAVDCLLLHLRGSSSPADTVHERGSRLLAPAHLLAVLCADDAPLHSIVLHEGGSTIAAQTCLQSLRLQDTPQLVGCLRCLLAVTSCP
jgi:hypothetical protein